MRVDTALLCDAATVREGLLHILGGGITRAQRETFPAPLEMTLALRVVMHRTEIAKSHNLELILQDEDGEIVVRVEGEFGVGDPDQVPPGEEPAIAVPWNFPGRPELPHEGRYSLEILIDGIHQASVPFTAVEETFDEAGGDPDEPQ